MFCTYICSMITLYYEFSISFRPLHEYVGEVHIKQVYEIAKIKQKDQHMQHIPLDSICRSILGSAHSMGVKVVTATSTDADYTAARAKNAELKRGKQGPAKDAKGAGKGGKAADAKAAPAKAPAKK